MSRRSATPRDSVSHLQPPIDPIHKTPEQNTQASMDQTEGLSHMCTHLRLLSQWNYTAQGLWALRKDRLLTQGSERALRINISWQEHLLSVRFEFKLSMGYEKMCWYFVIFIELHIMLYDISIKILWTTVSCSCTWLYASYNWLTEVLSMPHVSRIPRNILSQRNWIYPQHQTIPSMHQ